jgi:O-antigen/teichoic acid export membrane protein
MLIVVVAAPTAAVFFKEPRLVAVINVASLQFVINGAAIAPDSLLRREMRFRPLAYVEVSAGVVTSITTLSLALLDRGVWSLVVGSLVGAVYRTVALTLVEGKVIVPIFRMKGLRRVLTYGGQLTTSRILWYIMSQADILIAGKFLGKDALGQYSLALQLATLPMQKAMAVINQVMFPAFSRHQGAPSLLLGAVERGVRLLALGSVPVLWGVGAVAPEFVDAFLGLSWKSAVVPIQLVAAVVPIRMLSAFLSTTICAVGRADLDLRNTLVGAVVMPLGFIVGAAWGLDGLAGRMLITVPMVFFVSFRRVAPVLGLKFRRLSSRLAPSLLAGFAMIAVVASVRQYAVGDLVPLVRFACLVVAGALTYVGTITLADRGIWRELKELVRNEA